MSMGKATPLEAVYSLKIGREQLERLREIAEAEHRTVAQKIRALVDLEIERAENGS